MPTSLPTHYQPEPEIAPDPRAIRGSLIVLAIVLPVWAALGWHFLRSVL